MPHLRRRGQQLDLLRSDAPAALQRPVRAWHTDANGTQTAGATAAIAAAAAAAAGGCLLQHVPVGGAGCIQQHSIVLLRFVPAPEASAIMGRHPAWSWE